jgi:MFS family permease
LPVGGGSFVFLRRGFERTSEREERTLDVAVRDGMSQAAAMGAAETYFGAFGIFLNATAVQIGLLAALPPFFGSLCQLFSLTFLDVLKSRRFLIVAGARLQAFVLPLISILPFLVSDSRDAVPFLIIFALLYQGALGMTMPLWSSLIGDLVPAELRGRFFGFRNQRAGICSLLGILGGGFVLNQFAGWQLTAWGYVIVFGIACLFRLYSAYWLSQYDDPPYDSHPESYFTFWQFLVRPRYSNFARFVFFFSCVHFGNAFSAPFFAVYMLRDLHFSYLQFTLITAVAIVTQILTLQNWGRLADTFGSKKILTLCSFGVSLNPVMWMFSANMSYLVWVQIYSGIVWAGFNLASSTFLFDAVTSPMRARCAAYQAYVQGGFVLLGSLAGGLVAEHVPHSFHLLLWDWTPSSRYLVIFCIAGLIRLTGAVIFHRRFKEVREVKPTRSLGLIFHLFPITSLGESRFRGFVVTLRQKKKPRLPFSKRRPARLRAENPKDLLH